MKKNILLISAIAILMTLSFSCTGNHSENDGHNHGKEQESNEKEHDHEEGLIAFNNDQAKAANLKLETVKPGTFHQVIKTSGQILSAQGDEVTVVATSNGVVSFANNSMAEGSAISAGEVIARISAKNLVDGDPYVKSKIAFETAEKEYKRAQSLIEDKIISAKDFEQTKLRYETAKAAYSGVANKSGSNGIAVTSPISGFLKSRLVNQGEFVSTGQPIAVISQNKRLQLRAEVSEKYFNSLKSINSANFRLPYNEKLYKLSDLNGRLLSFAKASAQNSFYVPVTFELDNIGDIIPGSFAEVYLLSSARNGVISIPVTALTEEQGLHYVYVEAEPNEYRKQEVKTGDDNGDRIEIRSGLKENDKVVTQGAYQVKLASTSSVLPEGHSHNH